MSDAEPNIALRYMRRFQCIGGACEETCCAGWSVPVDEAHHRALKKAMSGTRAERARFRETHVRNPEVVGDPRRHAFLKIAPDGRCTLLTEQGLCSTHARYGEALLSDTCATYPRVMHAVGERIEVSGSLSCPEVARQALLSADAMELDVVDTGKLPRINISSAVATSTTEVYARYLDAIRGTVTRLLSIQDATLAARSFLVARLGDRTRTFFHRGCSPFDESRLASELESALDPRVVAQCVAGFNALAPSGPRAGFVLVHALRERLEHASGGESFRALVRAVFDSYGALDGDEIKVDPAALLTAYRARRDPQMAVHGTRLDEILTNYAKHYWMKEWFIDSPNLLVHAQKLHLRIALLRFLIFSHPALTAPATEGSPPTDHLERVAVEVVHKFSRAVEHLHEFVAQMEALLQRLELTTLAQSVFLLAL